MTRVIAVLALLAAAGAEVEVYDGEIHLFKDAFRDLPASFGPDLPFDGLRGLLVPGEPGDGCGNMTAPPPTNLTDNYKWIVIVGRFNCTFEEKVRNAMMAGYDCVIVYNNSTELETMSAQHPEGIDIPSVFVNKEAGDALRNKYTYINREYYIMVNGDLPFNINTHLLLPFAVVVALCLIIIIIFMYRYCQTLMLVVTVGPVMLPVVLVGAALLIQVAIILTIVKCIKDRRRARRHRLPNRSLRKIPTCKFGKGDPYDTCAICLDDYQEGERLRVLPCAHAYHAKCIDPWLTQNRRVCPVCKRKVLAAGEREARSRAASDSDDSDSPLLDAQPPRQPTQGGTFEEQRENPFTRAARLMSRLRRGNRPPPTDVEEAPATEETSLANETEEVAPADTTAETAPLIPPVAVVVPEPRRTRSRRRPRSSHAAPAPAPAPASDAHSINTESGAETAGEIGVAALPALPRSASTPLDRTNY